MINRAFHLDLSKYLCKFLLDKLHHIALIFRGNKYIVLDFSHVQLLFRNQKVMGDIHI